MATVASAIEDKIAELLAADSSLDDIAKFVKGMLYRVPDAWLPLCEINVWSEQKEKELTGTYDIIVYSGEIRLDVRMNDSVSESGRIVTEGNARELKDYVQAVRRILRDVSNRKLGALSGAYWAVRDIEILRVVSYGVESRNDDWQFTGTVPFVVRVQETNE